MREPYGYKEFKVKELYKDISRGTRFTTSNREEGNIPLVTAGKEKFGISGYVKPNGVNEIYEPEVVTVDMFGNVFYREYTYMSDDNIITLRNEEYNRKISLYITSVFSKFTEGQYDYTRQFRMKSLEDVRLLLPITPEGTPDYEYMEEYIENIKKKYIVQLEETYQEEFRQLEALGLDEGMEELQEPYGYEEFKVKELFDVRPTKHYGDLRDYEIENKEGTVPFITTTESNNGVKAYSKLEANNEGNMITYSDTTTADAIFYQSKPYIGRSHVQGMKAKFELTENKALYIITCIRKSSEGLYDYTYKFNRKRMNETDILLPITKEGKPDYEYMENYIKNIAYRYRINRQEEQKEEIRQLKEII